MRSKSMWTTMGKLMLGATALLAGPALLLLPGALKLPRYRRTSLDGIISVDDAVAACSRSGLAGWDLVAFAQKLVTRKFVYYSTRNLWDTPARAFAHGMGYCTQYNLALKQILDRLGFATQAVFCLKVAVIDNPSWTMGHTWLRVCIDDEARDVCAGRSDNLPGSVHFVPLKPVRRGGPFVFVLTQVGMILFCGVVEWKAWVTGRDPGWTFHRADIASGASAGTIGDRTESISLGQSALSAN